MKVSNKCLNKLCVIEVLTLAGGLIYLNSIAVACLERHSELVLQSCSYKKIF